MEKINEERKTRSFCVLCGDPFTHFISQPRSYCDKCLKEPREHVCLSCATPFTRNLKEPLKHFLERSFCNTCYKNGEHKSLKSDEETNLFKELILGPIAGICYQTPEDVKEEAVKEACAYFRLYYLYSELARMNDGTPLANRLPSTRLYLLDVKRRIDNINEILGRTKRKVRRIDSWYQRNKNKAEPSELDIKELESEEQK